MEWLVFVVLLVAVGGLYAIVLAWQRSEVISRRETREWLLEVLDSKFTAGTARNAFEYTEARKFLDEEIPPKTKRTRGKKKQPADPVVKKPPRPAPLPMEIEVEGGGKATIFSTFDDPFGGAEDESK